MEVFITILTPTYNREQTLPRLYNSLKKQTNYEFEWIIIDDGSIDNTSKIVDKWKNDNNKFKITYVKKENGGKHTAINRGLEYAKGKMIFIVDSDDYLTNDAIEKIIKYEKTINQSSGKYAGIAMNKGSENNKIIGTTFKGKYVDATALERKKYHINGDKAEIFYTQVLKNNKFPEFEGEKFVTEALVWNRIAKQGYKLRWFQDIIYICEYRDDGLSKKGISRFKDSPKGLLLYIQEYIVNFNLSFPRRCLQYEHYSNSIYSNNNIKQAAKDLNVKEMYIKIGIVLRKMVNLMKRKI